MGLGCFALSSACRSEPLRCSDVVAASPTAGRGLCKIVGCQHGVAATAARSWHTVQQRCIWQAHCPGQRRLWHGELPNPSLFPWRTHTRLDKWWCAFCWGGAIEPFTLARAVLCGWQVYQGRHLHRNVAVKVLPLDGGLANAVQREVRDRTATYPGCTVGAPLLFDRAAVASHKQD